MQRLWEKNFWYGFFRPYVDWCTKASYLTLRENGRSLLPKDGAIIYAPNHCNTLMDALVVLQSHKGPKAFGARADIFRNPTAARLLRFLKIVPLARERDGLSQVAGNYKVFDEVIDAMGHDVPFCIFAEGTHRAKRSLLPIKKGAFRLAAHANEVLGKPIYVVPVGLEYEDYFHYMRPASINYGKAINVTKYITDHPESSDAETYTALTAKLEESLSSLITYFPDDEHYDKAFAAWQAKHVEKTRWWEWPLAVLLIPAFIFFGFLCLPMWLTSMLIGRKFEDKAWLNTVRYATKFGFLPFLEIIYGVLGFIFLPWYLAIVLMVLLAYSHSIYFIILNLYRKLLKLR